MAVVPFSPPDIGSSIAVSQGQFDAVVFEMEHNPFDVTNLRHCLQYLLDRKQIAEAGTVAAGVTPFVRLPVNGAERSQWLAKQVLDMGAYGVIWPHIRTVEEAKAAVAACRYARPRSAPNYEPEGRRGDGPGIAARYWGLTQAQYYSKADVWPIDPAGEILVGMMCESVEAIENLPAILSEVPGIGIVIIGEGDLSQNLGFPRQYTHPAVKAAMDEIVAICQAHGRVCGHPHVDKGNLRETIEAGYRWIMPLRSVSFSGLEKGLPSDLPVSVGAL
ncbi:aldolase/citrate lyase family protein [Starkeya koreensis]|uniref:Aldolase/citrate lyase family protein n=1 Tax=Ancylobacter koreensis TaxID=266121 RepID=A0ABT0DGP3_9HYPH|nr:aldolase/citrate lyase family protein [Ancylobacter koreensis]